MKSVHFLTNQILTSFTKLSFDWLTREMNTLLWDILKWNENYNFEIEGATNMQKSIGLRYWTVL